MKQSLVRRKQNVQSGKVEAPPTTSSTPHPGYAPDAALHAIKRHALEFVNPKELQVNIYNLNLIFILYMSCLNPFILTFIF